MILLRPYDDASAMAVLRMLDASDRTEAELVRGAATSHLALFADWRQVQPGAIESRVVFTGLNQGQVPFAVLLISHTGTFGVAQAALLARDHRRFRRAIGELAVTLRRSMPDYAAERGINRIEARSWSDHPTASALLEAIGFAHEADMPGFGPAAAFTFRQFAWTSPIAPATL